MCRANHEQHYWLSSSDGSISLGNDEVHELSIVPLGHHSSHRFDGDILEFHALPNIFKAGS
jgi:hypothetical protein